MAKFGVGVTGEAQNIDASVDANGNLVGYFQMELGSGDDRVEIYESDNLIELDLSSTADQAVNPSSSTGEFSLSSHGYELGPDGRTQLDTGATPTVATGDSSSLTVRGTDTADATIDYISSGRARTTQSATTLIRELSLTLGPPMKGMDPETASPARTPIAACQSAPILSTFATRQVSALLIAPRARGRS